MAEFHARIERWAGVWANFTRIQSPPVASRAAMPYCTGPVHIVDNTRERHAGIYSSDSVYTQFPRILWNWLYGNANQELLNENRRTRKILFADIDLDAMPKPTFYTRFVTSVYGVGSRVK